MTAALDDRRGQSKSSYREPRGPEVMVRSEARFPRGPLDTLWDVGALGAMTDGELLDHVQVHRDTSGQDAFRILVQRHAPMVPGLCPSLLIDSRSAITETGVEEVERKLDRVLGALEHLERAK